ncbi:MAG: TetR/AcrR family transcriptional regulator [Bacteroidia bacterium]|nr:TetR/AcrR family transcriptional regulator [Bacteroidia bacterium]MBP7245531.1 TetR/AcrR family transcriptional regulator [Bacteroidia bacterium]
MLNKDLDLSSKEKILNAARRVFIRNGSSGARMQEIADEAGINKALLHYYFKNKEGLFELVFNDAFSEFVPKIHSIFSGDGSVMEKIERYVETHLDLLIKKPDLPMFVLNEMQREPERFFSGILSKMPVEPPFQQFLKQIEEEMKDGKIRTMNPRDLWMNVMSMTVFPFIGEPMLKKFLILNSEEYRSLLTKRKESILLFIQLALLPKSNNS